MIDKPQGVAGVSRGGGGQGHLDVGTIAAGLPLAMDTACSTWLLGVAVSNAAMARRDWMCRIVVNQVFQFSRKFRLDLAETTSVSVGSRTGGSSLDLLASTAENRGSGGKSLLLDEMSMPLPSAFGLLLGDAVGVDKLRGFGNLAASRGLGLGDEDGSLTEAPRGQAFCLRETSYQRQPSNSQLSKPIAWPCHNPMPPAAAGPCGGPSVYQADSGQPKCSLRYTITGGLLRHLGRFECD